MDDHDTSSSEVNHAQDCAASGQQQAGRTPCVKTHVETTQKRIRGLCLTPKMKEYLGRDITFQEFEELLAAIRLCQAATDKNQFHLTVAASIKARYNIDEERFLQLIQEKEQDLFLIDESAVTDVPSRERILRKESP